MVPVSRKISLLMRMEKQMEILQHKWAVLQFDNREAQRLAPVQPIMSNARVRTTTNSGSIV